MSTRCQRVLLCKGIIPKNDSEKSYKNILEQAGYVCDILPTLNFEYFNLEALEECLINSDDYSGLIFTSQNSIEAIDLIRKNKSLSIEKWERKPTYCVGPATASLAKNHLNFNNILGNDSGNAENLANFIVKTVSSDSLPLLYPCSEIARETIDKVLISKQIQFRKLMVYKTLPSKTLEMDFKELLKTPVNVFVFFSPSIVDCLIPLIRKYKSSAQELKLIAIGPATNDALNKLGEKSAAVASKPEPLSLLSAIQSCT